MDHTGGKCWGVQRYLVMSYLNRVQKQELPFLLVTGCQQDLSHLNNAFFKWHQKLCWSEAGRVFLIMAQDTSSRFGQFLSINVFCNCLESSQGASHSHGDRFPS